MGASTSGARLPVTATCVPTSFHSICLIHKILKMDKAMTAFALEKLSAR